MSNDQADADKLLTPAEVAAMFRVNAQDGHPLGAVGPVERDQDDGRPPPVPPLGGPARGRGHRYRRLIS